MYREREKERDRNDAVRIHAATTGDEPGSLSVARAKIRTHRTTRFGGGRSQHGGTAIRERKLPRARCSCIATATATATAAAATATATAVAAAAAVVVAAVAALYTRHHTRLHTYVILRVTHRNYPIEPRSLT